MTTEVTSMAMFAAFKRKLTAASIDQVCSALAGHDEWFGKIRYNALKQRIVFGGTSITKDGDVLTDIIVSRIIIWFAERMELRTNPDHVFAAVAVVADQNKYNPVRDYLRTLTWDGQQRVETWATDYLGVTDTPYARYVASKWLISAVARADKPGCKADYVLILEGPQRTGKSTAIRTLCQDPQWYTDDIHDMGDRKTSAEQLQGRWIVELGELAALGRSQIEHIKAFVSRQVDSYRPAYGRCVVDTPRTCVLVGSVNPDGLGYLNDRTGNLRFWPIKTTSIHLDKLAADRDQLWAEAAQKYRHGETWYLEGRTDPMLAALIEEQKERESEDPWHDVISEYCESRSTVTTSEVLEKALDMPPQKHDRLAQIRVVSVLTRLNYELGRSRVDGKRLRVYRKNDQTVAP